ncbi:MAG: hypothetical protein ACK4NC_02870 [Candidatus Gracilibacteria bacterium]
MDKSNMEFGNFSSDLSQGSSTAGARWNISTDLFNTKNTEVKKDTVDKANEKTNEEDQIQSINVKTQGIENQFKTITNSFESNYKSGMDTYSDKIMKEFKNTVNKYDENSQEYKDALQKTIDKKGEGGLTATTNLNNTIIEESLPQKSTDLGKYFNMYYSQMDKYTTTLQQHRSEVIGMYKNSQIDLFGIMNKLTAEKVSPAQFDKALVDFFSSEHKRFTDKVQSWLDEAKAGKGKKEFVNKKLKNDSLNKMSTVDLTKKYDINQQEVDDLNARKENSKDNLLGREITERSDKYVQEVDKYAKQAENLKDANDKLSEQQKTDILDFVQKYFGDNFGFGPQVVQTLVANSNQSLKASRDIIAQKFSGLTEHRQTMDTIGYIGDVATVAIPLVDLALRANGHTERLVNYKNGEEKYLSGGAFLVGGILGNLKLGRIEFKGAFDPMEITYLSGLAALEKKISASPQDKDAQENFKELMATYTKYVYNNILTPDERKKFDPDGKIYAKVANKDMESGKRTDGAAKMLSDYLILKRSSSVEDNGNEYKLDKNQLTLTELSDKLKNQYGIDVKTLDQLRVDFKSLEFVRDPKEKDKALSNIAAMSPKGRKELEQNLMNYGTKLDDQITKFTAQKEKTKEPLQKQAFDVLIADIKQEKELIKTYISAAKEESTTYSEGEKKLKMTPRLEKAKVMTNRLNLMVKFLNGEKTLDSTGKIIDVKGKTVDGYKGLLDPNNKNISPADQKAFLELLTNAVKLMSSYNVTDMYKTFNDRYGDVAKKSATDPYATLTTQLDSFEASYNQIATKYDELMKGQTKEKYKDAPITSILEQHIYLSTDQILDRTMVDSMVAQSAEKLKGLVDRTNSIEKLFNSFSANKFDFDVTTFLPYGESALFTPQGAKMENVQSKLKGKDYVESVLKQFDIANERSKVYESILKGLDTYVANNKNAQKDLTLVDALESMGIKNKDKDLKNPEGNPGAFSLMRMAEKTDITPEFLRKYATLSDGKTTLSQEDAAAMINSLQAILGDRSLANGSKLDIKNDKSLMTAMLSALRLPENYSKAGKNVSAAKEEIRMLQQVSEKDLYLGLMKGLVKAPAGDYTNFGTQIEWNKNIVGAKPNLKDVYQTSIQKEFNGENYIVKIFVRKECMNVEISKAASLEKKPILRKLPTTNAEGTVDFENSLNEIDISKRVKTDQKYVNENAVIGGNVTIPLGAGVSALGLIPGKEIPFCDRPENKNNPLCKPVIEEIPFCDRPENKDNPICNPTVEEKQDCKNPEYAAAHPELCKIPEKKDEGGGKTNDNKGGEDKKKDEEGSGDGGEKKTESKATEQQALTMAPLNDIKGDVNKAAAAISNLKEMYKQKPNNNGRELYLGSQEKDFYTAQKQLQIAIDRKDQAGIALWTNKATDSYNAMVNNYNDVSEFKVSPPSGGGSNLNQSSGASDGNNWGG